MSTLKQGSVINNYRIVKELGKGPLGSTFLAQKDIYNPVTGKAFIKDFAIKTLNLNKITELGLDPKAITEEAQILKNLSGNPVCDSFIACYYDYFTHVLAENYGGNTASVEYLIIVTDYIQGPSLQQLLLEHNKTGFETNELLQLMFEIAQAVDYLHIHGIAHQNIKPSNIIFDQSNNRLRLIDLAFSCSQTLNSQCKGKAGTVYYMPPELVQLAVDPSTQAFSFRAAHDIWSMGVVFYQMANPGKDFMNFTSNDPQIIAKDIQIQNVKPSENAYVPINSVIDTILTKDYLRRPTSGQVIIVLRLARPLCMVNNIEYDREEAEALLVSLGIDVDLNANDFTICKALTDYLNICVIKDNRYQKKHLLELASILGISADEHIDSAILCKEIQQALQTQEEHYSNYVTGELIRALSYISWIKVRSQEPGASGELSGILDNIQKRYTIVYDEAKRLNLINTKLLESRRQEITLKSLVYSSNASIKYGKVYAAMANSLIDVILAVEPNAQVSGIPLSQFKFSS